MSVRTYAGCKSPSSANCEASERNAKSMTISEKQNASRDKN